MPISSKFERLGLFYMLALSGIAAIIIISQILIQNFIGEQKYDSRTVNIAGRQRMLSQKISKLVLMMANTSDVDHLNARNRELKAALDLWERSHKGLLYGDTSQDLTGNNSETVKNMFLKIGPHYEAIVKHAHQIITKVDKNDEIQEGGLVPYVDVILANDTQFLAGMDAIVFQYDSEAREKVARLKQIEITLLVVSLTIIMLELIFIFRPIARDVRNTVSDLIASENESKKMTREVNKLYEELGKSYQDLEAIGVEEEQAAIFAKINYEGEISYMSDKFRRLLEYESTAVPKNLLAWFEKEGYRQDFLNGVMEMVKTGQNWNGEIKLTSIHGDFYWFDMSLVPINTPSRTHQQLVVIARDVTEMKEAKMKSREINREKIEKRVKEQQYRSVLILEGQEEERKRIAREIHDGIGQMLTALKLNLEAITPTSSVHTKRRLQDTRSIMKNVIREVRRVSFNLTPSSLNDFGLTPAIKKFCNEVNTLTDIEVVFENKTRFINRLDNNIETNLYRIVQEAVNNAIKYSKAEKITVSFEHNFNNLNIEVSDNGKGFEYERLLDSGHFGASGHGIFNMRERAAFVGAEFDVKSIPGSGTKILVRLPLN